MLRHYHREAAKGGSGETAGRGGRGTQVRVERAMERLDGAGGGSMVVADGACRLRSGGTWGRLAREERGKGVDLGMAQDGVPKGEITS